VLLEIQLKVEIREQMGMLSSFYYVFHLLTGWQRSDRMLAFPVDLVRDRPTDAGDLT
jgi:hypothetical protein